MFKKLKHGVPTARLDFLRQVPMLQGLSDKVLARIDSHVDEVEIQAGRKLTVEGTRAYEAFIVVEGTAEVVIGDEKIRETTVGEMIGEIGILEHTERTATVTALTDMHLLVINPRDVQWLFDDETLAARVQENLTRHHNNVR